MTWNTLTGYVNGNIPVAADVNKYLQNLTHLHTPVVSSYIETNDSSNFTTTATTWADIGANFNKTFTTEGGRVLALLVCLINNLHIDFEMDGTRLGTSGVSGHGAMAAPSGGSTTLQIAFFHIYTLSAGSHTLKSQWRVPTAGTGTIYTSYQPRLFVVKLRGG
jgi:hypothetical protein